MQWETIERPGYFGKKRDELFALWNSQYGENNWRIAWQWGDKVLEKEMALQIYEDAYYMYFKNNPVKLNWLLNTASDVYDTAASNVNSGLDYKLQETPNTHLHDISIRRVIIRLGEQFRGDHLVEVRWKNSEGYELNPGIVPFHKPEFILPGEIKTYNDTGIWWNNKSDEDWYQRNKLLQVKK
jgi:hypothetical protein